jgi:hypothetical protein
LAGVGHIPQHIDARVIAALARVIAALARVIAALAR